jgi:phosphoadenosine phosphosulfate reductase
MNLRQSYLDSDRTSAALRELFNGYSTVNRLERLYTIFSPDEVLVTSSFGTNAAYLLHLISRINPNQKIHFIDTGFHFKETLEYKKKLIDWLKINVAEIHPDTEDHQQAIDKKLWASNPDLCCHLNKIKPLGKIKNNFKVWISGLIKSQTEFRSSLRLFEDNNEVIKFHPLFDLEYGEIEKYIRYFKIPPHPMVGQGYESIGCTHCTAPGKGRNGRWNGKSKTECGLHIDYFEDKIKERLKIKTLNVSEG